MVDDPRVTPECPYELRRVERLVENNLELCLKKWHEYLGT